MVAPATQEGAKTAIDKQDKNSVQFRAVGNEALTFPGQGGAFSDLWGIGLRLAGDSDGLPAWWSPMRDKTLRAYVRSNPVLSAIVSGEAVRVRNMTYTLTLEDGRSRKIQRYHDMLQDCDFGKGFRSLTQKVATDLLTQDNGAFIELIGRGGNRDTQRPLDRNDIETFAHLDASRIWRTYDPEYPAVYTNPYDGKYHIIHYSRIIMMSQNEQPDELARGLGFCATSRAFDIARYIYDMQTYKREKVSGSSPEIAMLQGMGIQHFAKGLADSGQMNLNAGFIKFKNMAIIGAPGSGAPNQTPPDLKIVGLKNVPDGFDFRDETQVAMALLTMAFNVDIRDYFPLQQSGATKADAGIQHEKSAGKGRADLMTIIEDAINYRVLPDYVTFQYDAKDDIEDKQRAEIKQMRANTYTTMISSGIVSVDEARLMAAEEGDIDPAFLENQTVADDSATPVEDANPTGEAKPPNDATPPPDAVEGDDVQDTGSKAENHSGVMVALYVPSEVARKLYGITRNVFDNATPPEDMHLTLMYLGESSELASQKEQTLNTLAGVLASIPMPIIEGKLGGLIRFSTNEGQDTNAICATYDSVALNGFRQKIFDALWAKGLSGYQNHGFTPHITLAYVPLDAPTPTPDFLPDAYITFNEITLAWGNEQYRFSMERKAFVPKALSVAEKAIGGTRAFFATQMTQLINNAMPYTGSLRLGEFSGQLRSVITNSAIQALIDGLREGGSSLRINELPLELTRQLNDHISSQWSYANNFANEVYGGNLTQEAALARVPLWVSKAIDEMYFLGLLSADDLKKFKWVYGETDHCEDCLELNDKVYTAKQWRDAKIKPRMNELACGGYHCQCTLEETNDPLSEGEPTLVSGGVGNLSGILKPKRKKEHVH